MIHHVRYPSADCLAGRHDEIGLGSHLFASQALTWGKVEPREDQIDESWKD